MTLFFQAFQKLYFVLFFNTYINTILYRVKNKEMNVNKWFVLLLFLHCLFMGFCILHYSNWKLLFQKQWNFSVSTCDMWSSSYFRFSFFYLHLKIMFHLTWKQCCIWNISPFKIGLHMWKSYLELWPKLPWLLHQSKLCDKIVNQLRTMSGNVIGNSHSTLLYYIGINRYRYTDG